MAEKAIEKIKPGTQNLNPVLGGLIGAVAGAAIGSAAIAVWKDKAARKKFLDQFEDVKKYATDKLRDLKDDEYIRGKIKKHLKIKTGLITKR